MSDPDFAALLLGGLPTRASRRLLYRTIPALSYTKSEDPRFLYTSGRPNRWNPRSVDCLYFAESLKTANAEYESYWNSTPARNQPRLTFTGRIEIRRVIDLENRQVRQLLGLDTHDLYGAWRLSRQETKAQRLGRAVASRQVIGAIRYPSVARYRRGERAWNLVIYPSALQQVDRVEILGPDSEPLESLGSVQDK